MTLLSPAFLWAFALAAPLVAVYLLKVRPRRAPTTALFLWDQVFTQRRSTALLRRLRDVLSLLLMMLALTAAVGAMTRPRLGTADRRDVLILIDRSASMSAHDPGAGGSRLARAKGRALGIVRALGGGRRAAVATVSDRLRYRCYLTANPRQLREAIRGITPGQAPSAAAALSTLGQVAGLSDRLRVLLLSDGVGRGFAPPKGVELVKVAPGHADNAGITAADLVASPRRGGLTLMFRVTSSYKKPRDVEVGLYHGGEAVKIIPLTLTPGEGKPQVYEVAGGRGAASGAGGRYELRLKIHDALAEDNTAYLSVPPPHPVRVRVGAKDRYFFEQAVAAFARSDGRLALARRGERADLTIEHGGHGEGGGGAAGGGESKSLVVFSPGPGSPWVRSVGKRIQTPLPRDLAPRAAALRYVPVEALSFAGARRDEPAKGSAVLVKDQGSGAALVWQVRAKGRVALVFNMDPARGDFVLSPYFPVMIHAAATHLGGRSLPAVSTHPVGESVGLPGVRPGEKASVKLAGGRTLQRASGDRVRLDRAGFSRVQPATGRGTDLAASLLSEAETGLDGSGAKATAKPIRGGFPPWVWLTWLVVVVLVVEECLYHRRKVG